MSDRYSEEIETRVIELLKPATGSGYFASCIWRCIKEEVVADVLKCIDIRKDNEFTDTDITIAVGRTLLNRLLAMTPNQYQKEAMRTCPLHDGTPNTYICQDYAELVNGLMGLAGEAGECSDLVKKHLFQGHELDEEHLAKELGDVAWYLAESADAIGYNLEDIFRMNIEKLKARYPGKGFDVDHSLHRAKSDV